MMGEPERLLDQSTSPLELALLQEGRAYCASEDLRTHTLRALGLAASVGLAGSVLAWLSARSLTAKLVLALSTATLLGAIPASYLLLVGSGAPARTTSPPSPTMPTQVAPTIPAAAFSDPAPVRTTDSPAALPPPPTRASAPANSALRAELAALDAVRSTLANDDPAGALSFLGAYFRTFPRGRLHLEAEVLRIDALAKAGRLEDAKRHAQAFLKRHPNSVLTGRVRPHAER
jgi:hypothetical protein